MILLLCTLEAQGGAWVREAGGVYAKAGLGHFSGSEVETAAVELGYRDLQASIYGELGLPVALQLSFYVPYVLAENRDAVRGYLAASPGDGELALSRRLSQGKVASALSLGGRFPLYPDRGDERAQAFGGWADRFPEPGDGTVDLDLKADVGASLGRGVWTQGSAGYRHRFGPWVDGLPWMVQLGWAPSRQERSLGWLGVESAGLVNLEEDELTRSWTRLGGFLAVNLGRGLHAEGWGGAIPWAQASRPGASVGMGLSWTGSLSEG